MPVFDYKPHTLLIYIDLSQGRIIVEYRVIVLYLKILCYYSSVHVRFCKNAQISVRRVHRTVIVILSFQVDCLTYAAAPGALGEVEGSDRYRFYRTNICDSAAMRKILASEQPELILHLAAESHVDRSIDNPAAFMQTNILGTYTLLEAALRY